jgi:hypothetical protein
MRGKYPTGRDWSINYRWLYVTQLLKCFLENCVGAEQNCPNQKMDVKRSI